MNLQKIVSVLFIFIISGFYSQNNWFSDLIPNTYHSHPEFGASDENWHVDNIELIQYRRENAKTFIDINNEYHTITSSGNSHYFVGNQLFTIQQNATQSLSRFGIFKSDLPLFTNINDGSTSLQLHPVGVNFSIGTSKSISCSSLYPMKFVNLSFLSFNFIDPFAYYFTNRIFKFFP